MFLRNYEVASLASCWLHDPPTQVNPTISAVSPTHPDLFTPVDAPSLMQYYA